MLPDLLIIKTLIKFKYYHYYYYYKHTVNRIQNDSLHYDDLKYVINFDLNRVSYRYMSEYIFLLSNSLTFTKFYGCHANRQS